MKEKHDARESHVYRERIRWAERVKELREKETIKSDLTWPPRRSRQS